MERLISLLFALPAVIIAITVHEYSHAKSAVMLGDPTPKYQGRVTLDPFAHIDWIGILCLVFCGFGWGKPVNISSGNFKNPKRDMVLTSIAGPLSNLAMALVFGVIYIFLLRFRINLGNLGVILIRIIGPFVTWNSLLFSFNLIPVPPLDGYKVIRGLSNYPNNKFFGFMDRYGYIVLIVLVMTGVSSLIIGLVSRIISIPLNTISQFLF